MESRTEEELEFNKVQYKNAKKEAKKAVAVAKNNAYERLFHNLALREERMRSSNLLGLRRDDQEILVA